MFILARGTDDPHARSEHDDSGEKQECLSFGGRGHAAKMRAWRPNTVIDLSRR